EKFKYRQGQHLTLRKEINGEDIRRNYSLFSSPLDGEWKVAVKTIRDGVFSNYAFNELKKGDTLEVMVPHGEFTVDVDVEARNNYIAFAAGSSITPTLSIIKTHLHQEPNSTFKLFYLNRTVKSIIFKEEIEQLKNQFFERVQVFYFLTKEQRDIPFFNGRFNEEKMASLSKTFIDIPDTDRACNGGPQDMIFLIRDEPQKAGLPKEKIPFELVLSGSSEEENEHTAEILNEKAEGTQVTI